MNKVIMMGHVGKDPEIRVAQSGTVVASFSLAVKRKFSKEDTTDWFNCTAFGKTAEFIQKYINKGTKVVIEGELQNNDYEKNGVKHHSDKIIVASVEFAESKKAGGNQEKPAEDEFMNVPDDAEDLIPFA